MAISHAAGVSIAEFSTTTGAAHACRAHGIATVMGAPNVVRGASHFGNVSASELVQDDLLDILPSDYVPEGLLMAAVQLSTLWGDLPRAMATVTARRAAVAGMQDRGVIGPGKRADCIRFAIWDGTPVLRETWCAGRRVF